MILRTIALAAVAALFAVQAQAQRPTLSPSARVYVKVDTTVVALTNARVIDGTGAPAREGQTVIIRDGNIA